MTAFLVLILLGTQPGSRPAKADAAITRVMFEKNQGQRPVFRKLVSLPEGNESGWAEYKAESEEEETDVEGVGPAWLDHLARSPRSFRFIAAIATRRPNRDAFPPSTRAPLLRC